MSGVTNTSAALLVSVDVRFCVQATWGSGICDDRIDG
jgi:hypothetical protein